jgi:hypothetical protein
MNDHISVYIDFKVQEAVNILNITSNFSLNTYLSNTSTSRLSQFDATVPLSIMHHEIRG